MITTSKKIAQAFSIFHDGTISFEKEEPTYQLWKIDCEYLAEGIHSGYEYFWIKLYECTQLEFHPWKEEWGKPKEVWTTKQELSRLDLEIYTAKVEASKVKISCHDMYSEFDFSGGDLWLTCTGIEVFDQEKKALEVEELSIIAQAYWNNFS